MSVQYVASQQSQEHTIQQNTRYAFIGNKKLKWTDVKICILGTTKLNQFTLPEWNMHIRWKFLHIFWGKKFSFASPEMIIRNILYCYSCEFTFIKWPIWSILLCSLLTNVSAIFNTVFEGGGLLHAPLCGPFWKCNYYTNWGITVFLLHFIVR